VHHRSLFVGILGTAFTAATLPAQAGGFYLKEQSAEGVGRAFAGETALGADASTVYFNPSAMTKLDGTTVTGGFYTLFIDSEQSDRGTTRTGPGGAGSFPVGGNDGGNPFDEPVLLGNLYMATPVNDRLWLGLGVNTPFGVVAEYDDGFFGRYDSKKSDLLTVNIQPSAAYKLNDVFSIGGGLNIQYVDVELTNALPNLAPGSPDGSFRVQGDDWSLGWNVGVLASLEAVDIGLHYRSEVKHDLEGDVTIGGLAGPLAAQNGTVPGGAPLTMPDIASLGAVWHLPDGRTRLLADVSWYNWSDFEEIAISTASGARFESPQNYQDTWSFAVGGEYDYSNRLTLRTGVQFDETPTRDSFRTTRVPDGDRWWLTAGATYDLSETYSVALSYAHIFVSEESLNRTDTAYAGTPVAVDTTIRSQNTGSADIIGLGLTAKF